MSLVENAHPNFKPFSGKGRSLGSVEAKHILATTKDGNSIPTSRMQSWLNEDRDKEAVWSALLENADEVYLPTYGETFLITNRKGSSFYLKPRDAFTPCGWFTSSAHAQG